MALSSPVWKQATPHHTHTHTHTHTHRLTDIQQTTQWPLLFPLRHLYHSPETNSLWQQCYSDLNDSLYVNSDFRLKDWICLHLKVLSEEIILGYWQIYLRISTNLKDSLICFVYVTVYNPDFLLCSFLQPRWENTRKLFRIFKVTVWSAV